MNLSRRAILQQSVGAGLVAGMGIVPARAQSATLLAMVYLSRRLDATHAEFQKWYVEHHSPDFMTFARPYLTRYTQDFVEKGHMGAVDFDCISEFGYRSQELREALVKKVEEPGPAKVLAAHPRPGDKPGPNEAHDGPRRYSIDEQLIAGTPRGFDKPGTFKQAAMIKMKAGADRVTFNAEIRKYAMAVAGFTRGKTERVVVDLAVLEPGTPEVLYDAVLQLWPKDRADLSQPLTAVPQEATLMNVLDLVAYEADLSKGA